VTSAPKSFVNGERHIGAGSCRKAGRLRSTSATSRPTTTFTTKVTDFTVCDGRREARAAHIAAIRWPAGPRAENILKCTLKPLDLADYGTVTFTAPQQTRLQAVFLERCVCDWTKPRSQPAGARIATDFSRPGPGGVALAGCAAISARPDALIAREEKGPRNSRAFLISADSRVDARAELSDRPSTSMMKFGSKSAFSLIPPFA